jgi:hypothetical protein
MRTKMLIGAAGLAALVGAAVPAIAQYYPPPRQPAPGGIIGAIVNQYQYGRYPYGNYGYNQGYGREQYAIDRCARAVEARLNGNYGYGNWGYDRSRGNRYRNFGRVEGITRVERRSKGSLKVWGVASSGWGGYDGWNRPGYGNYGYHAGADLSWDCKVDRRGRVSNVDINRRSANWRGY